MPDDNIASLSTDDSCTPPQPLQLDGPALRAFAHPLRARLYSELEQRGPATSARLASLVGQSRGATSYHLRQLARHGLLEEVPDRGSAKERWWRTRPGGYAFNGDLLRRQPETAQPAEALIDELVRQRNQELTTWAKESRAMPIEWVQASVSSRTVFSLTRQELEQLVAKVTTVISEFRQDHEVESATESDYASAGSADGRSRVVVTFDALPWVDSTAHQG